MMHVLLCQVHSVRVVTRLTKHPDCRFHIEADLALTRLQKPMQKDGPSATFPQSTSSSRVCIIRGGKAEQGSLSTSRARGRSHVQKGKSLIASRELASHTGKRQHAQTQTAHRPNRERNQELGNNGANTGVPRDKSVLSPNSTPTGANLQCHHYPFLILMMT